MCIDVVLNSPRYGPPLQRALSSPKYGPELQRLLMQRSSAEPELQEGLQERRRSTSRRSRVSGRDNVNVSHGADSNRRPRSASRGSVGRGSRKSARPSSRGDDALVQPTRTSSRRSRHRSESECTSLRSRPSSRHSVRRVFVEESVTGVNAEETLPNNMAGTADNTLLTQFPRGSGNLASTNAETIVTMPDEPAVGEPADRRATLRQGGGERTDFGGILES